MMSNAARIAEHTVAHVDVGRMHRNVHRRKPQFRNMSQLSGRGALNVT